MTEPPTKKILRANWFTVILTWAGALAVLMTSFYFNTTYSVKANDTTLKDHTVQIKEMGKELNTKASIDYVNQMRIEREAQIKALLETKADKEYVNQVNKNFEMIVQMIRDQNTKLDNFINSQKK